jgi:hypothetical protein
MGKMVGMASTKILVAVRLDPEQVTQVDALIPVLSTPWHPATRSDALRAVVIHGLKTLPANLDALLGERGGEAPTR